MKWLVRTADTVGMVVREMLATDLGESQCGFYLWGTQKITRWNTVEKSLGEWKMVHIPTVMTEMVKDAQRRNRALRISYRNDLPVDEADAVQVL